MDDYRREVLEAWGGWSADDGDVADNYTIKMECDHTLECRFSVDSEIPDYIICYQCEKDDAETT